MTYWNIFWNINFFHTLHSTSNFHICCLHSHSIFLHLLYWRFILDAIIWVEIPNSVPSWIWISKAHFFRSGVRCCCFFLLMYFSGCTAVKIQLTRKSESTAVFRLLFTLRPNQVLGSIVVGPKVLVQWFEPNTQLGCGV